MIIIENRVFHRRDRDILVRDTADALCSTL